MQLIKPSNLACPLDGLPLTPHERQLRCPNGHGFDLARQGYVNLLPVQHKKSREPGDSAAMVEARRRFLDAGFYQPIARRLNALALHHLPSADACMVDAGCGEGYYLDQLSRAVVADGRDARASLIGLDIAKPAVLAAARRNRQLTWLVASNSNPPLLPHTVDMLLCMFGFPVYPAFARVLKPGGTLLLVDAGPEHLLQLREVIYPEVRKSPPPALDQAAQAGFRLVHDESLRYQTAPLHRPQIADLLLMTPHSTARPAPARRRRRAWNTSVSRWTWFSGSWNTRPRRTAPGAPFAYCIECRPIRLPSVSYTSDMKPYSPMEVLGVCTRPPWSAACFSSTAQSAQAK